MDPYVSVGVKLFAGLAATAAIVVALIVVTAVPWWLGLIILAIADALELAWAYVTLQRIRLRQS